MKSELVDENKSRADEAIQQLKLVKGDIEKDTPDRLHRPEMFEKIWLPKLKKMIEEIDRLKVELERLRDRYE